MCLGVRQVEVGSVQDCTRQGCHTEAKARDPRWPLTYITLAIRVMEAGHKLLLILKKHVPCVHFKQKKCLGVVWE